MKIVVMSLCVLSVVSLTGCVTTQKQAVARNNGAILKGFSLSDGGWCEWSGSTNALGFAEGIGVVSAFGPDSKKTWEMPIECISGSFHGPFVSTTYQRGRIYSISTGTYKNGHFVGEVESKYYQPEVGDDVVYDLTVYDADGKIDGRSITKYFSGESKVYYFRNGTYISSQTYNADNTRKVAQASSYSSSPDLGDSIVGMMGVAAGSMANDANMVAGGMAQMQGNNDAALGHYTQSMVNQAQTSSASSGSQGSGQVSQPQASAPLQRNLIEQYGLQDYRNASGDHIVYYIQAADDAYRSYEQTRDMNYYAIHKEYADIAKQFHEQTKTQ